MTLFLKLIKISRQLWKIVFAVKPNLIWFRYVFLQNYLYLYFNFNKLFNILIAWDVFWNYKVMLGFKILKLELIII